MTSIPCTGKMREKEVPFEKRKARRMTIADYDEYDYLIGMDEANIRNMKQICGGDRRTRYTDCRSSPDWTKKSQTPGTQGISKRHTGIFFWV